MKTKTFILAMMAVTSVIFFSCGKEEEDAQLTPRTLFYVQWEGTAMDGNFHDTLPYPNIRYRINVIGKELKTGEPLQVECKMEGYESDGSPWDEVFLYFDGKLITSQHIPFEKVTFDLGTYDYERDWTVRLDTYTHGRTDVYHSKFMWNESSRNRVSGNDDF